MMFSIICVAILTGSVVGRMLLYPFSYFCSLLATSGLLSFLHIWYGETEFFTWGTIDFAGGDVVHITSGVSAFGFGNCRWETS